MECLPFATFLEAKAHRDQLQESLDRASLALKAIPGVGSLSMGMTPDSVKASPEFKTAKQAFDVAFQALRTFNGLFTRQYSNELRRERLERIRAMEESSAAKRWTPSADKGAGA